MSVSVPRTNRIRQTNADRTFREIENSVDSNIHPVSGTPPNGLVISRRTRGEECRAPRNDTVSVNRRASRLNYENHPRRRSVGNGTERNTGRRVSAGPPARRPRRLIAARNLSRSASIITTRQRVRFIKRAYTVYPVR